MPSFEELWTTLRGISIERILARLVQQRFRVVRVSRLNTLRFIPEGGGDDFGLGWLSEQADGGHDEQGQEHGDGAGQRDAVLAPGCKQEAGAA